MHGQVDERAEIVGQAGVQGEIAVGNAVLENVKYLLLGRS